MYGLVNNAGVIHLNGVTKDAVVKTNVYGPKWMSEAFVPMIDTRIGRIVNLGSGSGPLYVNTLKDKEKVALLSSKVASWEELEAYLKEEVPKRNLFPLYGLTKAMVHKYTEISARENPSLIVNSVSPGYTDTNMTKGVNMGLGPKQTPE